MLTIASTNVDGIDDSGLRRGNDDEEMSDPLEFRRYHSERDEVFPHPQLHTKASKAGKHYFD